MSIMLSPARPWPATELIAFTAAEHQATLLSLDQRAATTYETVGVTVEQLNPASHP
jgi:hypothetical protein